MYRKLRKIMRRLSILTLIISLLSFRLMSQNEYSDGLKLAKLVDGNYVYLMERNELMRELELRCNLESNSIIDFEILRSNENFFLNMYLKDDIKVSTSIVINDDIVTATLRVKCTTTACYRDAGNCQPQYGGTCSECPGGDCKAEAVIIKPFNNNNESSN